MVFQPTDMSVDELQRGTERAWLRAYGWKGTLKRLSRTAAPLHLAVLTNLGYRHYARNLHRFYTCDVPPVGRGLGRSAA